MLYLCNAGTGSLKQKESEYRYLVDIQYFPEIIKWFDDQDEEYYATFEAIDLIKSMPASLGYIYISTPCNEAAIKMKLKVDVLDESPYSNDWHFDLTTKARYIFDKTQWKI